MKYFYCIFAAVTMLATVSAQKVLTVSVYYESHSPNCKDFITKQLFPSFCKVKDHVLLNLIPFGMSRSTNIGFICHHGFDECIGNKIQNCVLKRIQDSVAQLEYVNCAMSDYDQPGRMEKTCVEKSRLSVKDVNTCFTGNEGILLMLDAEKETNYYVPNINVVPTILFDDVYNDIDHKNAFSNFESTVCRKLIALGHKGVCSNGAIVSSIKC